MSHEDFGPIDLPLTQGSPEIQTLSQPVVVAPRAEIVKEGRGAESAPRPDVTEIMVMSPEIDGLMTALAQAQTEFTEIERTLEAKIKSSRADYTYSYAPLSEVLKAVRPALARNGIAILQFPRTRMGSVVVRTMLAYKNQWIYNELAAYIPDQSPQTVGSCVTFMRRYGLQSLVGVAAGYDDDGESAQSSAATPAVDIKPTPRKSAQVADAAPIAPTAVSPKVQQGRIQAVKEFDGGALAVKLENGFKAGTKDPAIIASLREFANGRKLLELVTTKAVQAGHLPTITEVLPLDEPPA